MANNNPQMEKVKAFKVRAKAATGFYRAGRHWPGGEGVTIRQSDLDRAQIAAIKNEPQLFVEELEAEFPKKETVK